MSGTIHNLFLKEEHGERVTPVNEAAAQDSMGLIGDVSFGRTKRQVLFIEKETLDEFQLVPGQVKENVTVQGIELAGLPAGTQLQAGEALFEVTGDCAPCQYIEDIRPGLMKAMDGRRGTLCRVLTGGTIRINDTVIRQ
ncbi:MAG: MOSC domain-containing protein [Candidatus Promineifilaceae bacterium]